MGIARRKAGKISKAVTKSISKGGVSCAHIRYFIRNHTKNRQKTTKYLEKRSDASKNFFLRIRHVQTRAVQNSGDACNLRNTSKYAKMLIMRHTTVTWIYLQNARKQDECNTLILNSSRDCSKIDTPTDVCPFRAHIANLTEPVGRLSARKGGRTLLEQELHVDGIHRYKTQAKDQILRKS